MKKNLNQDALKYGLAGGALVGLPLVTANLLWGMDTQSGESPGADVENSQDHMINTDKVNFSDAVNDDMAFGGFDGAFATARADVGSGGFFKWQGNYYNTYTKEEWEDMSPSDKQEYLASLDEDGNFHIDDNGDAVVSNVETLSQTEPTTHTHTQPTETVHNDTESYRIETETTTTTTTHEVREKGMQNQSESNIDENTGTVGTDDDLELEDEFGDDKTDQDIVDFEEKDQDGESEGDFDDDDFVEFDGNDMEADDFGEGGESEGGFADDDFADDDFGDDDLVDGEAEDSDLESDSFDDDIAAVDDLEFDDF